MSEVTARKRVRARKARHTSVLSCGHRVIVGALIVSRNRGPWICGYCALEGTRGAALTVAEILNAERDQPC